MKKIILMLAIVCAAIVAHAQVVTTSPTPLKVDSKDVEIYFHADQGNKKMMGLPASTEVYAHTGVNIMNEKGQITSWKYAPDWGDNSAKYKLEYVSANLWKLKIGDIRSYYNVPSNENISSLNFVFRTGDKSKEGKDVNDADIFVEIAKFTHPSSPSSLTQVPAYGATRNADGSVTFCICAPGKQDAAVVGSWNEFAYIKEQAMKYIDKEVFGQQFRYFEITLPESTVKKGVPFSYYYMIDGKSVGDPYARLVLDPYSDQYIPSTTWSSMPKYPSDLVQGVMLAHYSDDLLAYNWKATGFKAPAKDHLVIYEMLFRDFTGTEGQAKGDGTVRAAIEKIPYLKSLGVNAVELMPIMEFNGNNSWGYNTNFYFAPDKAYGSPQDYKEFIDLCHENGIAVILDIVFNQSDGLHPWYQLYPAASNPFYNASAPHSWSVLNDWKQDNAMVEQQWQDVVKFWLSEYKVDGFRFDLVKGLGDNGSYGGGTDGYNQSRVDRMKRIHGYMKEVNPDAYHINELLGDAGEDNKNGEDGQLNWLQLNNQGCQYVMGFSDNSDLRGFNAPDWGRAAGTTVAFLESHDEQRLGYKQYAFGEASVKGKIAPSCARLGSAAAQMLLTPGSKMIWQFQELGNLQNTKNTDGGNNVDPKKVDWNLLNNSYRKGLMQNYAELINIRLANKDIFSQTGFSMNLAAGDWYNGRKISYKNGDKELFVAINPQTAGDVTVRFDFKNGSNDKYQILSKTYNSNPSFNAAYGEVVVPANSYVVIASAGMSGVEDIVAAPGSLNVAVDGSHVSVTGLEAPLYIYGINGAQVFSTSAPEASVALPAGVYVLRSGAAVQKIAIR